MMPNKRDDFKIRYERLKNDLKSQISIGTIKRNEYLPSENELSQNYKLSRPIVRNILEELRKEGLLRTLPGKGTIVNKSARTKVRTIRIACYSEINKYVGILKILEEFEKENPSIKIDLLPIHGENYPELIRSNIKIGINIDLILMTEWHFLNFVINGDLLDITPFLPLDFNKQEEYYSNVISTFQYKNMQYAMPIFFSPAVIFYNKNIFDKAGVKYPDDSWDWNMFIKTAKKLTFSHDKNDTIDHYGFIVDLHRNRWTNILMQFGAEILNGNRCKLNTPEAIKGIKFCLDLIYKHKFPSIYTGVTDEHLPSFFTQGKTAMLMGSYYGLQNVCKIKEFGWDIAPLPRGDKNISGLLTTAIGISSHSKNPGLSRKIIEFFISKRAQQLLMKYHAPIPISKSIAEKTDLSSLGLPDNYRVYLKFIDSLKPIVMPPDESILEPFFDTMKMVWTRVISPENAVALITKKVNNRLKRQNNV